MYVKQKQRRLSGALTWELGPISGELCYAKYILETQDTTLIKNDRTHNCVTRSDMN